MDIIPTDRQPVTGPPLCPRCGRQHRSYRRLVECRFRPIWVIGDDRFGSFAFCPRGTTAILYPTREEAEQAKRTVDATRCGGVCILQHRVIDLGGAA